MSYLSAAAGAIVSNQLATNTFTLELLVGAGTLATTADSEGSTLLTDPGFWTLVPEPSAATLILLALLCGAGRMRRPTT